MTHKLLTNLAAICLSGFCIFSATNIRARKAAWNAQFPERASTRVPG